MKAILHRLKAVNLNFQTVAVSFSNWFWIGYRHERLYGAMLISLCVQQLEAAENSERKQIVWPKYTRFTSGRCWNICKTKINRNVLRTTKIWYIGLEQCKWSRWSSIQKVANISICQNFCNKKSSWMNSSNTHHRAKILAPLSSSLRELFYGTKTFVIWSKKYLKSFALFFWSDVLICISL